jgi:hypothetical protein
VWRCEVADEMGTGEMRAGEMRAGLKDNPSQEMIEGRVLRE